jgi:signal transduction histidine kinase
MTALFFLRMYGLADHAASAFITFSRWSVAWMGLTLTFALAFSVLQFFNAKNPQVRRQLRLVVIGSAFGLATPIVFSFYPELIWKLEQDRQMYTMLEVANGTGTYIMTSFLAIAIFHYRIWNIEPFIRRAILYGAASVVIYLSYLALIYLVDRLTIPSTNLVHFITLAFSMVAFLFLRDWIQRLIDRVFHRESYDSTNVIEEFEERLTGIYQVDKLISGIEESLNRIFHFKSFIFNMRIAERRYKAVYLTGTNDIALDEEFEVTGEIEELLRKSSIFSTEELMEMPKLFDYSRGELIIPLMDGEKPLGFFIAGPKMSEKSYSLQDIRVLSLLSRRIISLFQTASLYQNDLERQLMLERERYRIAEAMHDDVGASLTRITILSEMAASDCSNPEQTKQWLGKISLASREVVQDMNEIIWALNPKNGTLEELITFLHRFAFEYLGPTPVSCLFNLPEDLPVKMLSVQSRRNVYLSVKESLNNIVKHASAKKAEILVTINQDMLMISIKDDGTGFDPEKLDHPGNGLPNMMKRMEEIGGEFNLNSKTGQGTKTLLIAPLK